MTYQLHPLCTLFPRIDGGEFAALVEDIRANGLSQPIVLHDGMILDGGNRYRACEEAGVEPEFVEFEGESIVSFVLSANLHRRHMTAGQRAAIVASAQDWARAQSHGGVRKAETEQAARLPLEPGEQAASLPLERKQRETVADRAAKSDASERTQRMADKVAKADPELAKQVAHGEMTLPEAVEKVTGKRPGKKAAPKDPLAAAKARIAELEAELAAVRDELAEARDNMTVMADELAAYKRAADPEHAQKFLQQQGYVSTLEATRDEWMTKCSSLTREVKALQRKLGRAS